MLSDNYILILLRVVKNIKWSSAGVEVVCDDNTTYKADIAVSTVSLGVLKVKE